jgi:tetraacyldisaccharide 4'-kinase
MRAARPLLWPLVPLYRLATALREFEFRSGFKRVCRLGWPVVSVGNLSAGGAGKTPLTIALARGLAARGFAVDVLSRGYGRKSKRAARVDAQGSAENFGDEPLLIARSAGVPVYVAAERCIAGLLAELDGMMATPSARVHLLDDGFQHRQLHRAIDILLVSRRDLSDHLLPAGNLREPLRAIERAQVIAIPAEEPEVAEWLAAHGWRGAIWRLRRRMELPAVAGPAAAFCGIARPEQFFARIEAAGVRLTARIAFGDHHRYTERDLARIASVARDAGATAILTTEKDRVRLGPLAARLPASMPLQTVPLRIEIEDEAAAIAALVCRVRASA